MDLHVILPDLESDAFTNIMPSIDRAGLSTSDLLVADAADAARRARIPVREVRRLQAVILHALSLHESGLAVDGHKVAQAPGIISMLDSKLDKLCGSVATGYLTEVTGESGTGKTQMLLNLLLSAQLPSPHGIGRPTLYISTEAALPTGRLVELLHSNPVIGMYPPSARPSLKGILSIACADLQTQDHIIRYQLPVMLKRYGIGLVAIDSITANFRAELDHGKGRILAERNRLLLDLGSTLRSLAHEHDCAIVVVNQVADRFDAASSQDHASTKASLNRAPTCSQSGSYVTATDPFDGLLRLDHQQSWFTGWGDDVGNGNVFQPKTPSFGIAWTNQLSCRIALMKRRSSIRDSSGKSWRRYMKCVFSQSSMEGICGSTIEYQITREGLTAVEFTSVAE